MLTVPRLDARTARRVSDRHGLAAARALVLAHGWNSTSHQVLDPGMLLWFSGAGDAVVGYVRAAGFRVVAGAPVAPGERLAAVAAEFEADARRAGERVCYFAVEERFAAALGAGRGEPGGGGAGPAHAGGAPPARRHARHLIGLQPVWEAAAWSRRFDAKASLRAQRNRAANKGITVAAAPATAEGSPELRACHAAWLRAKRLPRLGFLAHSDSARADPRVLRDRRLFVARHGGTGAAAGRVAAYLAACPVPKRRGWLVEKVVRDPAAPNGSCELLLDAALRALSAEADRFTLGLAPLAPTAARPRGPGPRDGGGPVDGDRAGQGTRGRREPEAATGHAPDDVARHATEAPPQWLSRVEALAVRYGRGLYDLAGLHAFKGKFEPDAWEPVYLLSAEPRLTPRAVLAVGAAFLAA